MHAPTEPFGTRLRRLRKERGLTQRELTSDTVSHAYVSRLEAGTRQPSVQVVRSLASKLGVDPRFLETGHTVDPAEERALRLLAADAATRVGLAGHGRIEAEALLVEAGEANDVDGARWAQVTLARALLVEERPLDAIAALNSALAAGFDDRALEVEAVSLLASAYAASGTAASGVQILRERLAEAEDEDTADRYLADLAGLLARGPDAEAALATLPAPSSTASGDWSRWARDELATAAEATGADAFPTARRAIVAAYGITLAADAARREIRLHEVSAAHAAEAGDTAGAIEELKTARRLADGWGLVDDAVAIRIRAARLADVPAEAELRVAVEIARTGSSQGPLARALWALGDIRLDIDAADRAVTALEEAFELQLEHGDPAEILGTGRSLARALRALGRDLDALDVLDTASAAATRS